MHVVAAQWLVGLLGLYLLIGVAIGVPFVLRGVKAVDPSAREGSVGFRLMILPGSIALWPFVLRRWRSAAPPPEEDNAHRRAARARAGRRP